MSEITQIMPAPSGMTLVVRPKKKENTLTPFDFYPVIALALASDGVVEPVVLFDGGILVGYDEIKNELDEYIRIKISVE